ncbi:MAG: ribonuclease III [Planctomycetes bacterium]|nr:ribonuclease III [Planctomycetota bacterium]
MATHESNLSHLEDVLGYRFRQRNLLRRALEHSSHSDDHNERLEFLGDAVLDLVVSGWLFDKYKNKREGRLTEYKSMLVSRNTLARVGMRLGLEQYLEVGEGLKQRQQLPSSLAGNAVEAILGAVYLDAPRTSVINICHEIILRWLEPEISDLPQRFAQAQAKQTLQIVAQKHYNCLPDYKTIEETTNASSPLFLATVAIKQRELGHGQASSKKGAEQKAAWQAILFLREEEKFTELRD